MIRHRGVGTRGRRRGGRRMTSAHPQRAQPAGVGWGKGWVGSGAGLGGWAGGWVGRGVGAWKRREGEVDGMGKAGRRRRRHPPALFPHPRLPPGSPRAPPRRPPRPPSAGPVGTRLGSCPPSTSTLRRGPAARRRAASQTRWHQHRRQRRRAHPPPSPARCRQTHPCEPGPRRAAGGRPRRRRLLPRGRGGQCQMLQTPTYGAPGCGGRGRRRWASPGRPGPSRAAARCRAVPDGTGRCEGRGGAGPGNQRRPTTIPFNMPITRSPAA